MTQKPPTTHDRIELRSPKVRDIISDVPSWILRHGTTLLILFFLLVAIAVATIPVTIAGHTATIIDHFSADFAE